MRKRKPAAEPTKILFWIYPCGHMGFEDSIQYPNIIHEYDVSIMGGDPQTYRCEFHTGAAENWVYNGNG